MFFVASKILEFLINPLFWVLALLIAAIRSSSERRKSKLLLATMALFVVAHNDFLSMQVMGWWEIAATPYASISRPYEVVIVLGGVTDMQREPRDRTHLNGEADRLVQAVDLYKRGLVRHILVTGGSGSVFDLPQTEAEVSRNLLLTLGVPDTAIWIEEKSRNTHENALYTKALLQSRGVDMSAPQLLVTSAFHMRRSLACFEKEGLKVDSFATSMRYYEQRWYNPAIYLVPTYFATQRWDALIHEWVGFVMYKIKGYV